MAGDPNMDALQELVWEELRREARNIEGDLDFKLSSYAKLDARFNQEGYVNSSLPRSWKSIEMEIESLLEKLIDINDSMSRCPSSAASTTSGSQKLARHRDILHDFTQASGSVNPSTQLLQERAAIHGSISHVICIHKLLVIVS